MNLIYIYIYISSFIIVWWNFESQSTTYRKLVAIPARAPQILINVIMYFLAKVEAWWKSWSFKLNRFLYYWPSSSTTGFIKISNKASTNFLLQCIFHHHYFACFPNASLNSIRYFSIWYLLWCVQFSLFYCFTSHLRMRLNLVLKLR